MKFCKLHQLQSTLILNVWVVNKFLPLLDITIFSPLKFLSPLLRSLSQNVAITFFSCALLFGFQLPCGALDREAGNMEADPIYFQLPGSRRTHYHWTRAHLHRPPWPTIPVHPTSTGSIPTVHLANFHHRGFTPRRITNARRDRTRTYIGGSDNSRIQPPGTPWRVGRADILVRYTL